MKRNKALQILCLAAIAFILFFFSLLTPYTDSAGEYNGFSDDAFLVLHVWGALIFLLVALGMLLARGSRKWVFILYGCIAFFVIVKLIYLNSLTA